MIPESYDTVSLLVQPLGAFFILFCIDSMLPPINFNNQLDLHTHKVHDVIPNRMLPPEFESIESPIPQMHLHHTFCIDHIFPELPRPLCHLISHVVFLIYTYSRKLKHLRSDNKIHNKFSPPLGEEIKRRGPSLSEMREKYNLCPFLPKHYLHRNHPILGRLDPDHILLKCDRTAFFL